jgi:hypothetical protein
MGIALNQSSGSQMCQIDGIGVCTPANKSSSNKYYEQTHLYPEPNIALISVILLLSTFFLSHTLKVLRRSSFLNGNVTKRIYFNSSPLLMRNY